MSALLPDDYERDIGPLTLEHHAMCWADMAPHVATLTALARTSRTIVELGVRGAVSSWAFLDGLPPRAGKLWSVDAADVLEAGMVPRRVRKDRRWRFIVGDDMSKHVARALPPTVDMVFIDTEHEYHQTIRELDLAKRLEARTVVLHDWMLADVQDAGEGFARREGYKVSVEPSQWGLGMLRR